MLRPSYCTVMLRPLYGHPKAILRSSTYHPTRTYRDLLTGTSPHGSYLTAPTRPLFSRVPSSRCGDPHSARGWRERSRTHATCRRRAVVVVGCCCMARLSSAAVVVMTRGRWRSSRRRTPLRTARCASTSVAPTLWSARRLFDLSGRAVCGAKARETSTARHARAVLCRHEYSHCSHCTVMR